MKLDFPPGETFRGTRILRQKQDLAYAYVTSHKAVDADGAPNAYHPDDTGLDLLANAGYPDEDWWPQVLVPDQNDKSKAYEQRKGKYKGYFIAMTALKAFKGDAFDPLTYVDSREFPYVVIPAGFEKLANVADQGDVGLATHLDNGKTTAFIVGDYGGGGKAKLGEGSIALFTALGGKNPNPRNGKGVPDGRIQYILFPGSRRNGAARWPRTNKDIRDQVVDLIAKTPGIG
jgi:hypothetical protein